jgi:eukaryotic-like serine/threonine-protein kinase
LLHRDVNPANIMLQIRNGESAAVLIDFGLARDFDHDLTQTRTEEITPGYTPLELYSRDAERGAYTDIYALGATLYELLTGKVPPNAQDRKLSNAPLMFPGSIRRPMKHVIKWAMELEGKNRPQSVREWLDMLSGATSSVAPALSPSVPQSSQSTSPQRWDTWQWLFAGLVAIGTLLGGIAAMMTVLKPSPAPNPTQITPNPTQTRQP